jgi:hypothetical protein
MKVSRMRAVQKVSYAEAVRKVEDGGKRMRIPVSSRPVQNDPNSLYFSKVGFVAFVAMVIKFYHSCGKEIPEY